jgi:hypothetical protein
MKKITFILLSVLTTFNVFGQTTVQSEDFTTYTGLAATVPAGWTFSYNGNYTTTQSSGTSGPNSYKFGANGATITSPMFVLADSLSFWMKGNSTDTISTFFVLESPDNINWDTIAVIRPINTAASGMTLGFPVSSTSHYISFSYMKSLGNVAFDDYRLFISGPTSVNEVVSGEFSIYPNPGNGIYSIELENSSNALVTVYDLTGKKILSRSVGTNKQLLDLSSLENGIYMVMVQNETTTITKKIIVSK